MNKTTQQQQTCPDCGNRYTPEDPAQLVCLPCEKELFLIGARRFEFITATTRHANA